MLTVFPPPSSLPAPPQGLAPLDWLREGVDAEVGDRLAALAWSVASRRASAVVRALGAPGHRVITAAATVMALQRQHPVTVVDAGPCLPQWRHAFEACAQGQVAPALWDLREVLRQPEPGGVLVIGKAACEHPATVRGLVAASRQAHAFVLDLPTLEEDQAQQWIARHASALFTPELQPGPLHGPDDAAGRGVPMPSAVDAVARPAHPYTGRAGEIRVVADRILAAHFRRLPPAAPSLTPEERQHPGAPSPRQAGPRWK